MKSSEHGIITPQCVDKMLSNDTFLETKNQGLLDGLILSKKDSSCTSSACSKWGRVYTLAEILSKIFVKKNEGKSETLFTIMD